MANDLDKAIMTNADSEANEADTTDELDKLDDANEADLANKVDESDLVDKAVDATTNCDVAKGRVAIKEHDESKGRD